MPRIRTIKPEITSDAKLSGVSMEAELTFILAITQADDHGLLAGAPRQLLGALYPIRESVTTDTLLGWIAELVEAGMARWHQTRDGSPVLELVNWGKHQRIDNAGRSQLLGLLKDADARGDSPQPAESRGLDLGPRTKDPRPGRGNGKATDNGTAEALEILGQINALVEESTTPGQGSKRYIRQAKVREALGDEIATAFKTMGGSGRILNSKPEHVGIIARDFAAVLARVRQA